MKTKARMQESSALLGWPVATFGVYAILDGAVRGEDGMKEYVQAVIDCAAAESEVQFRDPPDLSMVEWLIDLGREPPLTCRPDHPHCTRNRRLLHDMRTRCDAVRVQCTEALIMRGIGLFGSVLVAFGSVCGDCSAGNPLRQYWHGLLVLPAGDGCEQQSGACRDTDEQRNRRARDKQSVPTTHDGTATAGSDSRHARAVRS